MKKNLSTPDNRAYWKSVEDAAAYVEAHYLCFSNRCIVNNSNRCTSKNNKTNQYKKAMKDLGR